MLAMRVLEETRADWALHGPVDIRNKFVSLPIPFCDQTANDAGNLYCADKNLEELQEQLVPWVENILITTCFQLFW